MKFEQMRYVLAVNQTGSISKAAKQLYLSRPNISNALKSLEQELGVELLIRDTGGVRFTEKGMSFVRHCQVILDEVEQINTMTKQEESLEFVTSQLSTSRGCVYEAVLSTDGAETLPAGNAYSPTV